MKYLDCEAIVLRFAEYKEADRVLTLFSPQHGKLTAGIRGVKKQASRLRCGAEVFARGDYSFAVSGSRLTVTGFSAKDTYYPLRNDMDRLSAASLACNMTEAVINDDQPEEGLYTVLTDFLFLCTYDDSISCMAAADAFLMCFLESTGFAPGTDGCVRCGRAADGFSAQMGGAVCHSCAPNAVSLSAGAAAVLREAAGRNVRSAAVLTQKAGEDVCRQVFRLLLSHAEYCLDRRFKTAGFLI